ncbi:ABC transporter permease [Inquilinus limosus]|uniref:ABC transporter permease n=1 Tax=Inquilinus limosus TaxID=171674 RepID=UPI003F141C84
MSGATVLARRGAATAEWLPAVVLLLTTIAAWEAAIWIFEVSSFIVPAPSAIGATLAREAGPLLEATRVTAVEILVGFLVAAVVGIALAMVIARFRLLGRALYPLIVLFQTVPKVALAPIFILWFGYDLAPKVGLILVIAFFPVTLSMLAGLEAADPGLLSLMRSVGASRTTILLRIQIPYALPQLMAGLKIAVTFSVIGAIVGEFAGASAGLGYLIQFASTQLDTPMVFAALLVVSVVGVVFYYAMELLERLVVPWAPKFDPALRSA